MKGIEMATVRKTITLSDTQDNWIKSQIARGSFTNDSEYIRDLLRRDQSQNDRLEKLRQSIAEGLNSGLSDQSLDDIWATSETRASTRDD